MGHNSKAADQVSWYSPHLETSLALIERAAVARSAPIVNVGEGDLILVNDLLLRGYENITRAVPSLPQVLEGNGLQPPESLAPGQQAMLKRQHLVEFHAEFQVPSRFNVGKEREE